MNPRRVVRTGRPVYSRGQTSVRPKFRLPKWNFRLVAIIMGAIILIVLWVTTFAVKTVRVVGERTVPGSRLQAETLDELKHRLGWGNLTTVDTEALAERIKTREPLLGSVGVSRQWPHGLVVTVEERTPGIIWSSGGQTYLVDDQGSVVGAGDKAPSGLVTVIDTTNLPVKVGDRVVSDRFISFISDLVRLMPQTKLIIKSISVPETTTEVFVTTDKTYVVKFDTTKPAAESITALNRVLTQLAATNKTPTEYIDLRIENRAYYK